MTKPKLKLTVALPTYGRDEVLIDTIKDVLKQDFDDFELVVVDQTKAHDEATEKYFKTQTDTRLRYFRTTPPSLTAARNFAIAEARSDLILFLDDDIELHDPHFLRYHYEAFQKDKAIVAVAGRVVNKDNRLFIQHETEHPLYHDRYGLGHDSFNCPNSQYGTDFPGGNVALRVDAIKAIGGFDPSYKGSAIREESDAAHRLVKAGGKVYFEAQAAILHLAAPTGGTRIYTHQFDNQMFYTNDILFALKTVKLRYLPIGLAKRYRTVMRGANVGQVLRRSWLFLVGFCKALRFCLFPDHTVASEVA
jgi:glycosyltransferase involved in cell wall biosynthesis